MTDQPSLSGKKLIKLLLGFGFEVTRVKGSHHFLRHVDGRTTVIPVHGNEDVGKGLMRKILSDCELTLDELFEK